MHVYNWKRDDPSTADYRIIFTSDSVDLRSKMPPVFDQGQLGSCTANALAGAFEFDEAISHVRDMMPSRLFIYYNERNIEGTVKTDSGASLRDGIKTMNKTGVCAETLWPYDISKFTEKPPANCYAAAAASKVKNYARLNQSLSQFKKCLMAGNVFVFGVLVYESFNTAETEQTGVIPMPNVEEEKLLGGHAIVCVGFNDETQQFIFRNSWGGQWGDAGYGYLPYDYLLSKELSSDFWVINSVSGNHMKIT